MFQSPQLAGCCGYLLNERLALRPELVYYAMRLSQVGLSSLSPLGYRCDLPPELLNLQQDTSPVTNWEQALRQWADQALGRGQSNLLDSAVPTFERIMIETALKHTAGRRRDAAVLLGWGRNTLTRKIKELGMKIDGDEDDSDEA